MLDYLTRFGIPEKEARVYLALLELGAASVSEVAKRAKVPRTNTYHLLNSLLTQGLVSSQDKGSKMMFSAEDPSRITQMLKNRAEEYQQLYKEADRVMPEFYSIYNKEGKLKVRFFEGVEGVISAYEDTLNAKTEILAIASVEHTHSFFPGYFPAYYMRRAKRGIKTRAYFADFPESRRIQSLDEVHNRTSYIVPTKFASSPSISIYDHKVAIMSLREKFGAIIESEEVADALRHIFQLALERAEQYDRDLKRKEAREGTAPKKTTKKKS